MLSKGRPIKHIHISICLFLPTKIIQHRPKNYQTPDYSQSYDFCPRFLPETRKYSVILDNKKVHLHNVLT